MDAPGSEDIVQAVRQMRLLGAVSDGGLRAPSAPHRRHPRGRGDRVRGGGAHHHRPRQRGDREEHLCYLLYRQR